MIKIYKASLIALFLAGCHLPLLAQDYGNFAQLTQRVNALAKTHPSLVKVRSITKTDGGKDIWMISIGSGAVDKKPGIAVVGGVYGPHVLGPELALGFAESLLAGNADSLKNTLARASYYIFPNMSPDASEQYFAKLRYTRAGNARDTDDDRDGKVNEDGYDDLDGDGRIRWIRVEDPTGKYKLNPDDPRSLILADGSKGEAGKYILLSEGIDNDKDGEFNEDGEGGVAFNKNMSYQYPNFQAGAGEYAVSEKENRALLDNLFEMFNVYAVVTFGPNNNLSSPVTFSPSAIAKRIITGYYEPDVKVNAWVSEKYNKITGLKDAPRVGPQGGDFSAWAYFHYGRFSYSTPGWWVPKSKPDTAKKQKALTNEDPNTNYLRWAESQNINGMFSPWKEISHPDFPGKKVEVGGLDPFALINPPYNQVAGLVKKHTDFLVALAAVSPQLDIVNVKTEKLAGGMTRVTATIMNRGAIPTQTKIGERSYWVKKIAVKLEGSQTVISGRRSQVLDAIEGGGSETLTWLVKGSGSLNISAESPTAGAKSITVSL